MKIDFNRVINDMDGKPILVKTSLQDVFNSMLLAGIQSSDIAFLADSIGACVNDKLAKSESLTARLLASNALGMQDPSASGDQFLGRMELALKIRASLTQPVEVEKADVKLILDQVLKLNHSPVLYFRMKEILEAVPAA